MRRANNRNCVVDLRKQARHLENEIDAKLVAFSKLGINTSARHVNADEIPLLDEEQVFENMASEIETLLSKVGFFFFLSSYIFKQCKHIFINQV